MQYALALTLPPRLLPGTSSSEVGTEVGTLAMGEWSPRRGLCLPTRLPIQLPLFYQDFSVNDDLYWWTVLVGVWSWVNGVYDGNSGRSVVTRVFPVNREVEADMITIVPGGAAWDTAWLHAKWVDSNNRVTLLLHTTGLIELGVVFLGVGASSFVGSALSPLVLHRFHVILIGTRALVYIDGTLYLNIVDVNIPSIVGTVCFEAATSHCQFDNLDVRRRI